MKKVLIIGATSAMAEATARRMAQRGDALFLVGRSAPRLQSMIDDLRTRGAPHVHMAVMDANDFNAHAAVIHEADAALGGIDTVLISHGTLSDQAACARSVELTMAELRTNALSVVAMLTLLANLFEQRRTGTIAVISSVAGERGRQSNYVYGSAKAMVTAFMSGLRQRLAKAGVSVVTIKPGFVDTPMTSAFRKNALWISPDAAAGHILNAIDRGTAVAYVPGFWRLIMLIIRALPDAVFRRLAL
ncbi:SDR family oxidoreductase [Ralstonia soli]|uniref:SDR family oxidoreductase n=1 Tax=Ralstonia soli TaxID=2953896 RepID=A0ABT1AHB2_9RALS|nr:SDR family oxidoreductase [Ralstonia soli]MCO5397487.1 SDR family oxidoreductase [Ralstonia soli]